jgi:hypothetical protein
MIVATLTPNKSLTLTSFKELVSLLVRHDQLEDEFRKVLGKKPKSAKDLDLQRPICYGGNESLWSAGIINMNGSSDPHEEAFIEGWAPSDVPNHYEFQISITLLIDELANWGVNIADYRYSPKNEETTVQLWFKGTTSSEKDENTFELELLTIFDDRQYELATA